jgi:hypothetical protein
MSSVGCSSAVRDMMWLHNASAGPDWTVLVRRSMPVSMSSPRRSMSPSV